MPTLEELKRRVDMIKRKRKEAEEMARKKLQNLREIEKIGRERTGLNRELRKELFKQKNPRLLKFARGISKIGRISAKIPVLVVKDIVEKEKAKIKREKMEKMRILEMKKKAMKKKVSRRKSIKKKSTKKRVRRRR